MRSSDIILFKRRFFLILFIIIISTSCNKESGESKSFDLSPSTESIPQAPINTEVTDSEPSQSNPAQTNPPQVSIVTEAQNWFMDINESLITKLNKVAINNLIVVFSDDESEPYEFPNYARGRCDKSGTTPKIILFRADWVGKDSTDVFREGIFYHLVGHCVYNRQHHDAVVKWNPSLNPVKRPVSYMHSNWGINLFKDDPLRTNPRGPTTDDITSLKSEFLYYEDNTY